MTLDRILAILGITISLAGIAVSIRGGVTAAGGMMFAAGALLSGYAIWILFVRAPFKTISLEYRYLFQDGGGSVVKVERRMRFRVLARNVTSIWARNLTSTGEYRGFRSNIGKVAAEEHLGGAIHVRVDFHIALRPGLYDWVLGYEAIGAFSAQTESVSFTCLEPIETGALEVTFHPTRIPQPVERITYHAGHDELLDGTISVNAVTATARWEFAPRPATEYFLRWMWA